MYSSYAHNDDTSRSTGRGAIPASIAARTTTAAAAPLSRSVRRSLLVVVVGGGGGRPLRVRVTVVTSRDGIDFDRHRRPSSGTRGGGQRR
jgi:hypothetical protein